MELMEIPVCAVCEKLFYDVNDITHVKKKGARTFKLASELRGDGKFSSLDLDVDKINIMVHKTCRSTYTHHKNYKTAEKILCNSLIKSETNDTDGFDVIIEDENKEKEGLNDLKTKDCSDSYEGGNKATQDTTEDHLYSTNNPKDMNKSVHGKTNTIGNGRNVLMDGNNKINAEHSETENITNLGKVCTKNTNQQDSTQDYEDGKDPPEYLEYSDDAIEDQQETNIEVSQNDKKHENKISSQNKKDRIVKQKCRLKDHDTRSRCSQVCNTCLTRGCKLYLLVRYAQIFNSIIGNNDTRKTYVCEECLEEIRKIHKFRVKALNAQKFREDNVSGQQERTSYNIKNRNEGEYADLDFDNQADFDFDTQSDFDFDNQSAVVKKELDENPIATMGGVNQPSTKRKRRDQHNIQNELAAADSESNIESVPVDFKRETETSNENENNETKKSQCKIVYSETNLTDVVKKIKIEPKEAIIWMRKERNSMYFRNLKNKCALCVSKLQPRERLERHLLTFHRKSAKAQVCPFCKIYFKSVQELNSHLEDHFFVLRCVICGYLCYRKHNMNDHLTKHKRSIECLECGLMFEYATDLNDHYKKHLKCNECGIFLTSKDKLRLHFERHHTTQQCKECNKTFLDFNTLRQHNKRKHVIERSEKSFCVSCGIQFDNVFLFMRHVSESAAHAHERKKAKRVTCPICSRVLSKKSTLQDHMTSFHTPEKRPSFTCPKCGKQFMFRKLMTTHIKYIHDGAKVPRDKICMYCKRGFTTNRALNNHINTHTGEKPHKCPYCEDAFRQRNGLRRHLKNKHKTELKSTVAPVSGDKSKELLQ